MKKKIETANAPKALGPYSQAISQTLLGGELLFVSGQLPMEAGAVRYKGKLGGGVSVARQRRLCTAPGGVRSQASAISPAGSGMR